MSCRSGERAVSGWRFPPDRLALTAVEHIPDGVPEALRRRIFDPGSTTRQDHKTSGPGLGLVTSQSLVEAMTGERWCENRIPATHEAVFHILLPQDRVEVAEGEDRIAPGGESAARIGTLDKSPDQSLTCAHP